MRILDVFVNDPREEGEYRDPFLEIKVDEAIQETASPTYNTKHPAWRIVPCGPFVAVEHRVSFKGEEWEDAGDIGYFNTLGFHREQLISVRVVEPDEHETINLQMGVARARRLLRKYYGPEWHIIVDEHSALEGRIVWRVERKQLRCFAGPSGCRFDTRETVWYGGAHVPLCPFHRQQHEERIRADRTASRAR